MNVKRLLLNGTIVVCSVLAIGSFGIALLNIAAAPPVSQQKVNQAAFDDLKMRARVFDTQPELKQVEIAWRRGGEGLGGEVVRGAFAAEDGETLVRVGEWTAWLTADELIGRGMGWRYPTIMVYAPPTPGKKRAKPQPLEQAQVELEFVIAGAPLTRFVEHSPQGSTVTFAFSDALAEEKGVLTSLGRLVGWSQQPSPRLVIEPLSSYARNRRETLQRAVTKPSTMPKQTSVMGRLGGYGEGAGRGIRHTNPEIIVEECKTLQMLGINGVKEGRSLIDVANMESDFRRMHWSRIHGLEKLKPDQCPYDPAIAEKLAAQAEEIIADARRVGAEATWGQKGDEIGVGTKQHLAECPTCAEHFRAFLRREGRKPEEFGAATWGDVAPYPIWLAKSDEGTAKGETSLAPVPESAADCLRYYYTARFMTQATAPLYEPVARRLRDAGIPFFSLMHPTPSWLIADLDWHEFFESGANTAVVSETSNRDPQVWQWESYLADVARGISQRHDIPIGFYIKPHRGAVQQRMLSLMSRGMVAFEWYTYGPDYSKGDSFSQSPELLVETARAAEFLGHSELYLYGASWATPAEVAFVSPRSSAIWGKATDLGVMAYEDAKWVYLALRHAHVPVDVLSEQQLCEGKLDQYKAIYVVGPNLRRDAARQLRGWVERGGVLWTDCLGLACDEANQPANELVELFGSINRQLESWGSVSPYKAADLTPLEERNRPRHAVIELTGQTDHSESLRAVIGRESFRDDAGDVLAQFGDGKPAVTRRQFGRGKVWHSCFWAGLTYSARVRRPDYDMSSDFNATLRELVTRAALEAGVQRPVVSSHPLVEAVALEKNGQRSVALMNWSYRHDPHSSERRPRQLEPVKRLRIDLPIAGEGSSVRSLRYGALPLKIESGVRYVILRELAEVDLLVIE